MVIEWKWRGVVTLCVCGRLSYRNVCSIKHGLALLASKVGGDSDDNITYTTSSRLCLVCHLLQLCGGAVSAASASHTWQCPCHLPLNDTHLLQHHGTHLLWCEHTCGVIVGHLDANLIILQGNDFEGQECLNVSLER